MSTDYRVLYLNDTKLLAKTMVILSKKSVDLVNDLLILKYGSSIVDQSDPKTWKYYLNISGQYHRTDKLMQVTSLDTLETIDFTLENLQIHTATAEAYSYGTRFYYGLLERFPDQEQLILGILNPVDIDTAISSPDGTILTFPKGLVESQEITLISELQDWVYRFIDRWDTQAYGVTSSLYATAQHAILYLQLLPKILNLRLKRCKTNEAHSFHIRSYLASHGNLDRYYDYMTTKQALFLYRNLDYIQLNNGRTETFDWLVSKILTDRNIPLAEYQLRLQGTFDKNYFPEYKFKKIPINTEYNTPNQDYFPLQTLLNKETPLAIGNTDYIYHSAETVDKTLKNAASSVLLTKDLESSMVDHAGNEVYPLYDILFDLWGWLASKKLYHVAISFKDPKTGELRSMFSDDAFIYYLYLMMKALNAPIDKIPKFILARVPKLRLPTLDELKIGTERKFVEREEIAKFLLAKQPRITQAYSVSSFNKLGTELFNANNRQWYLISRTEHLFERAEVEKMVSKFYQDSVITFADDGKDFALWLKDKSLPDYNYSTNECYELMQNIYIAATGHSQDPTRVLANIQRAMLSIMEQLSSYSIQYIQQINSSPIKMVNWAAIRLGDLGAYAKNESLLEQPNIYLDLYAISRAKEKFNFKAVESLQPEIVVSKHKENLKVPYSIKLDERTTDYVSVRFPSVRAEVSYPGLNPAISDKTIGIGLETYLNLTPSQQSSVRDIYNSPSVQLTTSSNVIPMNDIIHFNQVPSETFLPIVNNTIDPNEL